MFNEQPPYLNQHPPIREENPAQGARGSPLRIISASSWFDTSGLSSPVWMRLVIATTISFVGDGRPRFAFSATTRPLIRSTSL
jgi:hypothetical protein